jgi:hydrogenase expression/formation protein HypE
MSLASGLGFKVEEERVPVLPQTRDLCRKLVVDPLKLIGSGALLLSVARGKEQELKKALTPICEATAVGRFTGSGRILVRKGGRRSVMRAAPEDELWRALARRPSPYQRL